jgi:lysosomal acid lipase/cholesteryl ester hydrolase
LDDAEAWIVNHYEESVAFVLASEGYDVWLTNSRGSEFSRRHLNLNPDSKDWD